MNSLKGKHISDLTPTELKKAAKKLGITGIHPSFVLRREISDKLVTIAIRKFIKQKSK